MKEHFQIFRWFHLCLLLVSFLYVEAGTTLEELNENQKSTFSSITSVKGASETNRHHFKATVDGPASGERYQQGIGYGLAKSDQSGYEKFEEFSAKNKELNSIEESNRERVRPQGYEPFPNGFNPVPPNPNRNVDPNNHLNLNEPSGHHSLSATNDVQPNGEGSIGYPYDRKNGNINPYGYEIGQAHPASYGAYVPPPMLPYPYGHGYRAGPHVMIQPAAYPNTIGSYQPPNGLPYSLQTQYNTYPNFFPTQYGVQAPQAYRSQGHKLKINTEYQENGQHSGSFKELNGNGNCGYGSGFCGGYNGAFNRPGF